ncbi:MAG: DNA repair protein RadC [Clostridia bacterium]|nr:DNA repair protein RadC [Clostridia bacterium]
MSVTNSSHAGHRARMKSKFSEFSDRVFSDHELLELLLFYAIPRINVNEIAHDLINEFGSLDGVFSAEPERLCRVNGVGKSTVKYLFLIGRVTNRIGNVSPDIRKTFSSISSIGEFLVKYYRGYNKEKLCVLFFDSQMKIIKITELDQGGPTEIAVSPQQIAREAVICNAVSVLIAHNHPSGNLEPSAADQNLAHLLDVTLRVIGVPLIDHLIVSDTVYVTTMATFQNSPRYNMYSGAYGATFAKEFFKS